ASVRRLRVWPFRARRSNYGTFLRPAAAGKTLPRRPENRVHWERVSKEIRMRQHDEPGIRLSGASRREFLIRTAGVAGAAAVLATAGGAGRIGGLSGK